jgi:hypothetical protein
MATTTQYIQLFLKDLLGLAQTDSQRLSLQENLLTLPYIFKDSIWGESNLIPSSAPIATSSLTAVDDNAVYGVITARYRKLTSHVPGTPESSSFTGAEGSISFSLRGQPNAKLENAIPSAFGPGYLIIVYNNNETQNLTQNQLDYTIKDGIITFYSVSQAASYGVTAGAPPRVTFWEYTGIKGFGAVSGVGNFGVYQRNRGASLPPLTTITGDLTFDVSNSGTDVNFSYTSSVLRLNIPQASTPGVTGGLLSYSEYDALATKAYVDAAVQGLVIKDSVKVATTAPLGTGYTWNNDTTPSPANGYWEVPESPITLDGVSLSNGDRVLVKNETGSNARGNRIFVYDATNNRFNTAPDFNNAPNNEVRSSVFVFVSEGTINSNAGFVITTPNPIVLGTTEIYWSQFSGAGSITAGNGLQKSGNTLSLLVSPNFVFDASNNNRLELSTITGLPTVPTGGSTAIPVITVDSFGRVTALTTSPLASNLTTYTGTDNNARVAIFTSNSNISSSPNLTFDSSVIRLGLGFDAYNLNSLSAPHSTFHVLGSVAYSVVNVNQTNYDLSINPNNYILFVTTGTVNVTITLPTPTNLFGRPYKIQKVDNGTGTVSITGHIEGSVTTIVLNNVGEQYELTSDGSTWRITNTI